MIPEPDDRQAARFQEIGAGMVALLAMLAAVQFHGQGGFDAEKIHYKWSNGGLPAEFRIFQLSIPQHRPERAFGIGHIASKPRGMRADLAADRVHLLHCEGRKTLTQPSPAKAGEG